MKNKVRQYNVLMLAAVLFSGNAAAQSNMEKMFGEPTFESQKFELKMGVEPEYQEKGLKAWVLEQDKTLILPEDISGLILEHDKDKEMFEQCRIVCLPDGTCILVCDHSSMASVVKSGVIESWK